MCAVVAATSGTPSVVDIVSDKDTSIVDCVEGNAACACINSDKEESVSPADQLPHVFLSCSVPGTDQCRRQCCASCRVETGDGSTLTHSAPSCSSAENSVVIAAAIGVSARHCCTGKKQYLCSLFISMFFHPCTVFNYC